MFIYKIISSAKSLRNLAPPCQFSLVIDWHLSVILHQPKDSFASGVESRMLLAMNWNPSFSSLLSSFFLSVAPHFLLFPFSYIYPLPIFWISFWVLNHSINVTYLE